MTTPRKKYSPTFKAQIVQELLKEEQTLAQIASKHGVHPTQLRRWREAALTALPSNFADEAQFQKHLAAITEQHDKEKEKLYAEIGKLTIQLNWLKKTVSAIVLYQPEKRPSEPLDYPEISDYRA